MIIEGRNTMLPYQRNTVRENYDESAPGVGENSIND